MDPNDTGPQIDIPQELRHPKTPNWKKWMMYLGRSLSQQEMALFAQVQGDNRMNRYMSDLYQQCQNKNMYVPLLTNQYGNCLFESLMYHGIGNNQGIQDFKNIGDRVKAFRKSLACFMYLYRDYKNFFPTQELTLTELFDMFKEVEYVQCYHTDSNENNDEEHKFKEPSFYKYTYNVMCQDLATNYSWGMLVTELMLMVISRIYHLEIIIVTDTSDYEHKINVFEGVANPPPLRKVYLGKLREVHYVPVDVLEENEDIDPMWYDNALRRFFKWARIVERIKIKQYLAAQKDTSDSSSSDSTTDMSISSDTS